MAPAAPGLAANLSRAVFFCHCFLPAGGAERRRFRRPGARAGSMDPRSLDPQKMELADFDLSRIEEQDPSLIDDFKYVLPRALPRRAHMTRSRVFLTVRLPWSALHACSASLRRWKVTYAHSLLGSTTRSRSSPRGGTKGAGSRQGWGWAQGEG